MARADDNDGGRARRGTSRRGFIGAALLVAGSSVALAGPAGAAAMRLHVPARARRPVVAFHADQLYLDMSGTAEAYVPPVGLRTLDDVDADALHHHVYSL